MVGGDDGADFLEVGDVGGSECRETGIALDSGVAAIATVNVRSAGEGAPAGGMLTTQRSTALPSALRRSLSLLPRLLAARGIRCWHGGSQGYSAAPGGGGGRRRVLRELKRRGEVVWCS